MYYVSRTTIECMQIFFYSGRSQRMYFMLSFCSLAMKAFSYKQLDKSIFYLILYNFWENYGTISKIKILLVRLTCSIISKNLIKAIRDFNLVMEI